MLVSVLRFIKEFVVDSDGKSGVEKWIQTCIKQKSVVESSNMIAIGRSFKQAGDDIAAILPHVKDVKLKQRLTEISNKQHEMAGQIETGKLSKGDVVGFLKKGLSTLATDLITESVM